MSGTQDTEITVRYVKGLEAEVSRLRDELKKIQTLIPNDYLKDFPVESVEAMVKDWQHQHEDVLAERYRLRDELKEEKRLHGLALDGGVMFGQKNECLRAAIEEVRPKLEEAFQTARKNGIETIEDRHAWGFIYTASQILRKALENEQEKHD